MPHRPAPCSNPSAHPTPAWCGWPCRISPKSRHEPTVGLPRYVAVGLLTGYAWLALAGLLWAGAGPVTDGSRYDATLHLVFLGFTMPMIFAHAPVILPAVLRRPLPYGPWLYAPLALLHTTQTIRVLVGDVLGVPAGWRWGGVGNVPAVR
ncbi:hypothetical protein ACIODS_20490 [Micromonospora chalcea]|uniref:hypothetical protein n=1 Tax=Micromonospora chalcea TaxID=1874 RepID=UPI003801C7DE